MFAVEAGLEARFSVEGLKVLGRLLWREGVLEVEGVVSGVDVASAARADGEGVLIVSRRMVNLEIRLRKDWVERGSVEKRAC